MNQKKRIKQSKVFDGYIQGMNIRRFSLEILMPIVIASIIITLYFIFVSNTESVSDRILKINSSISTVIAIQVGFNITCLALIASFGRDTSSNTFTNGSASDRKRNMNQIVSSYIYGIVIYLIILILGFIHLSLLDPLTHTGIFYQMDHLIFFILKIIYFFIWTFLILHGFAVFLRNAKLIQLYLLVNVKNS